MELAVKICWICEYVLSMSFANMFSKGSGRLRGTISTLVLSKLDLMMPPHDQKIKEVEQVKKWRLFQCECKQFSMEFSSWAHVKVFSHEWAYWSINIMQPCIKRRQCPGRCRAGTQIKSAHIRQGVAGLHRAGQEGDARGAVAVQADRPSSLQRESCPSARGVAVATSCNSCDVTPGGY